MSFISLLIQSCLLFVMQVDFNKIAKLGQGLNNDIKIVLKGE